MADIPVGGALAAELPDGSPVILVRPGEDEVTALSAVCTHRGCTVAPDGKVLRCPCHDSVFDLSGKNTGGPAPRPLARLEVTVTDGQVHVT